MKTAAPETRERVLSLLRRHGAQPTSFQILEPGLAYWFWGDERAVVAYADVGGAWVTAGEPVCAADDVAAVLQAFLAAAAAAKKRVRFFHVSDAFAARCGLRSTCVGELSVWDPRAWADTLAESRSLREQLRRARAKGVTARLLSADEIADPESPVRKRCEALIARWLESKPMAPMQFMVRVHPFEFPEERRFVVAEREGHIEALGVAIPVYALNGFFLEDLLRDPAAPNGCAELVVDTLFRSLAADGVSYATLGLAPLSGDVGRILRVARDSTMRLYNFSGVRAFKDKLRPARREPVHLAFPPRERGVRALLDALSAFAPHGLVRFALSTLVHQRRWATFALTALLVPWTLGLLWFSGPRWFPSALVYRAWLALDVLLIVLMLSLMQRWRSWVVHVVIFLTSLDALLTTLQFALWQAHTVHGIGGWIAVILGCTGPLLAATFFWATRLMSAPRLGKR